MSALVQLFEVVQAMSGQRNSVVIPRPYLNFFSGDQQSFALAAVLNQLVFWSGKSTQENGWFYKSHEELGGEVGGLSEDQIRRIVEKLSHKYLPGVIEVTTRKVNGTPVKHYRIDGDALIARIFPSALETAESLNGNGEDAERKTRSRGMGTAKVPERSGEDAVSYLYPDHYTDHHKQIIKPSCPDASPPDKSSGDDSSEDDFVSRHPEAVVYSPKKRQWGSQDDLTCAEFIWVKITAMYERAAETDGEVARPREPDWAAWANEVRLMVAQDGRTHKQICSLFKRASLDRFWCKNILSPSKLREKWDELTLKLSTASTGASGSDKSISQLLSADWNTADGWENVL